MSRMRFMPTVALALMLFVSASAPAFAADPADEATVAKLLLAVDDLFRGESSRGRVTMNVKTSRWERSLSMEVASKGTDKSLIRIVAPAKERGTATLKVANEIWNYLPKVDRTIKVPASMMAGAWMGSHFSNDDLVRESRYSEDFGCELTGEPDDGDGLWIIDCTPHEDTVVVWGRVMLRIRAADELAEEARFYDEDDELVRTMQFLDIGDLAGRQLPRRMRMVPADKSGEYTEMVYDELEIDVDISDRTFSLQELRR